MLRPILRLSALLVTLAFSGTRARADFLYAVSGLPAPMVNGQSFVAFIASPTPIHPLPTATNTDLVLANVVGFSANVTGFDSFNTPLTLKIDFADPAHPGSDASASFAGTLAGSLGAKSSSLLLTFLPQSVNIDLAGNPYTVSMPATSIPVAGNGSQSPFGVHVAYTGPPISQVPEPSALLLAAFGVPLLGLVRRRKRSAQASAA